MKIFTKKPMIVTSTLLCLSLVFIVASYAGSINLLQNPGFEALGWPPANWSEWQGSASGNPADGVAGYISTSAAHTGSQSAVRELYGSGIRWGGYSQDVDIDPGVSVTASGYLMSPSSDNPLKIGAEAYIELKFFDASYNELAVYKSDPLKGASSWVEHSIIQEAPAGTAKARFSFVLYTGRRNSSGKVYFDDAAIEIPSEDNTPPVVTIISPSDASVVSAGIIPIVGTVDDLSITTIDLNGNAVPCYEGKWEANLDVIIGENTITATATDDSNNVGTDTVTITYDPNASSALFDIIYPADGEVYTETPALVTATLSDPANLYININGKEYLAVDGVLIARVPITAGANTLELRSRDQTGYEEVQYLNVTYDTSATDFGGEIANNSFENSNYPQIDWIWWSGNQSFLPTDGSVSFISNTVSYSGLQSSGQQLYGGTIRWGGISQEFPVKPGDTVNASGYVASFSTDGPLSNGAEAWVEVKYISNRNNEIEKHKSEKITAATDSWVELSVSSVVPDGAETAIFSFAQLGEDGATGTVYFDDAYVEIIDNGYTPPPKNPFDKPQSTGPVQISGNTLLVNSEPFTIKGVCYQAVPIGYHVTEYDVYSDPDIYNRDLPLLRDMGTNVVRTYSKITSMNFLDACYNDGMSSIYVVMGFYIDGYSDLSDPAVRDAIKSDFRNYVNTYKNHPAVLMWSPGNETEWAYAGSDRDYYTLLNELAEIAYIEEGSTYHPVTAALANIYHIDDNGLLTTDEDMDYLDVWGGNVYEGITFGDMFDDFAHRSGKVFWVSEFGVDAWHTNDRYGDPANGYLDEASQEQYDVALWDEIASRSDVCSGGAVFEYSDEWWKDDSGSNSAHNYGGFPYRYKMAAHLDEYSNEEWYGIVAVSDNGSGPDIVTFRQTFYGLQSRWAGPVSDPKMHVKDISVNLKYTGPQVRAQAAITIFDENGQPVPNATVSGVWSGSTSDSDSGSTDSNGQVTLESDRVRNPASGSQFTFTVTDVVLDGWIYDSASNIETSDSISIP